MTPVMQRLARFQQFFEDTLPIQTTAGDAAQGVDAELRARLATLSSELKDVYIQLERAEQRALSQETETQERELASERERKLREDIWQAVNDQAKDDLSRKSEELRKAGRRIHDLEKLLAKKQIHISKLEEQDREVRLTTLESRDQIAALMQIHRTDARFIDTFKTELFSYGSRVSGNMEPSTTVPKVYDGINRPKGIYKRRRASDLENIRTLWVRLHTRYLSDNLSVGETYIAKSEDPYNALASLLGERITPRMILMILELRKSIEYGASTYMVPNKELLSGITVCEYEMQMELRRDQAAHALSKYTSVHNKLRSAGGGLKWVQCSGCMLPKLHWEDLTAVLREENLQQIYDFLPFRHGTPCCSRLVCKACIRRWLEHSMESQLWWVGIVHDGTWAWLACKGCGERTGFKHWRIAASPPEGMKALGMPEGVAERFAKQMEQVESFREHLYKLGVNMESSDPGLKLLRQLDSKGYVQDITEPMAWTKECLLHCDSPEVLCMRSHVNKAKWGRINSKTLLTITLKREKVTRSCVICSETYHEIAKISEQDWVEACKGFEEFWAENIFYFPSRAVVPCDHEMDTCKTCYRKQIATQLDEHGNQACDRLSCPQCDRKLSHAELQHLASEEDFARYERYQLLNALSKEPNFRWCLAPNCENGQIYESAESVGPWTECHACHFEMCFQHQTAWHKGQTCAQYDSQLKYAEEEGRTEEWKLKHAKLCPGPGCGKPIVKGEFCFHMTCYQCQYQFCWECLADWQKVRAQKSAHNEGCFFLTSTLSPTEIHGTSVHVAR